MKTDSNRGAHEARRQIDENVAGVATAGQALLAVVSGARRVQTGYAEALAPFELSLSQFQLLDFLRRAGPPGIASEKLRIGMRELCISADCEAHVERRGWLVRDNEGTRRITESGRQLLAELAPVLEELASGMASALGTSELADLIDLMARIPPETP